ncbi:hypothetical protein [Spongiimicrobium salis]|uniref:hypothetical protein n=1 Tax=Spongiimicrobium salis TaxID=1667022 RepID=UPI00374C8C86
MTSKTKKNSLIFVIVLVFFACYQFAISNTLDLRKEYIALSKEETRFKDIPKQLSILSGKQQHYDSLLTKMNLGNTSMENNLIKAINTTAQTNSLKVIDFNRPHIYEDKGGALHTFDFTLEGSFTQILKGVYHLEQEGNFGEIVHLNFEKKRNYNTRKDFLNATFFLQHIK